MITQEDAARWTQAVIGDCLRAIKKKKEEVRREEDPLSSARYRGLCQQEFRIKGMSEGLTFVSSVEASVLLECSVDEIWDMRQAGQLLGVSFFTGEYLYPRFQFWESHPLPGMEEILQALAENNDNSSDWAQFFIVRSPCLSERPGDYLKEGGDIHLVVEAARNFRGSTFLV